MAFSGDSIFWVEVEKIVANPFQPRREFDEARLKELAESVRMYGVLQPLTVTRKEVIREDGTFYSEYELIAGERRLRASRLAGLSQVPVIIREGEDNEQEKLELAIIENLQREDLNAVDRARAFKQLADAFGLMHAQVAEKVGRSREYVSNSIRLLALPEHMLESLRIGDISEGHARTLLMLNDKPEELETVYREILMKKMSVRETERIARKIAHDKVRKKDWVNTDPQLMEIERKFTESLGTRVQILKTDYGGKLTIDYFSEEDLARMLAGLAGDEATVAAPTTSDRVAHTPTDVDTTASENDALSSLRESTPLQDVQQQMEHTDISDMPADTTTAAEPARSAEETPASEAVTLDTTSLPTETPPATETAASSAPETPSPQRSSLAAALAAALGTGATQETPASAAARTGQTDAADTEHAVTEPLATQAEQPAAPKEENSTSDTGPDTETSSDDESNLYAVRNFSL